MGGLGDVALILVIGGVGLYALYAYNQGALGTGTTTGTTEFIPGESYVDPTTGLGIPATNALCQQEGGIWQGYCCSCPNNNCHTKCGVTDVTQRDVCVHEGGLWEPNGIGEDNDKGCCRCPNLDCSDKCGADRDPAHAAKPLTTAQRLEGVCKSEGAGNAWNFQRNCCSCPNKICQQKCPSPTRTPLRDSPRTRGAKEPEREEDRGTDESRSKSTGGGVGGPSDPKKYVAKPAPAKPAAKPALKCPNGKVYTNCPKCKSLCNSPSSFDACCKANSSYARSYLAGSSNRLGPGYTRRDDFRHLTNVEFPAPIDFLEEATLRPYYLGNDPHPQRTALRRRFDLNANAKSNFSMRFSG